MTSQRYGIHWFCRDLRIAGNSGLSYNFKKHSGKVLGVFAFDSKFLGRPDFSHNRFAFFIDTLKSLKEELTARGGDLLVLDGSADEAFGLILNELKKNKIEKLLTAQGIECHTERDHLVIEPDETEKFYQVFTPL